MQQKRSMDFSANEIIAFPDGGIMIYFLVPFMAESRLLRDYGPEYIG